MRIGIDGLVGWDLALEAVLRRDRYHCGMCGKAGADATQLVAPFANEGTLGLRAVHKRCEALLENGTAEEEARPEEVEPSRVW